MYHLKIYWISKLIRNPGESGFVFINLLAMGKSIGEKGEGFQFRV